MYDRARAHKLKQIGRGSKPPILPFSATLPLVVMSQSSQCYERYNQILDTFPGV